MSVTQSIHSKPYSFVFQLQNLDIAAAAIRAKKVAQTMTLFCDIKDREVANAAPELWGCVEVVFVVAVPVVGIGGVTELPEVLLNRCRNRSALSQLEERKNAVYSVNTLAYWISNHALS